MASILAFSRRRAFSISLEAAERPDIAVPRLEFRAIVIVVWWIHDEGRRSDRFTFALYRSVSGRAALPSNAIGAARNLFHQHAILLPSHAGDMTLAWDTWGTFLRENRRHNARGSTGGGHYEA